MALSKEQLGQVLVAIGEEARRASVDPVWLRRQRHGDPTAIDDLAERACFRLGLAPKELKESLKADPKLGSLVRMTIESTIVDAQQQAAPTQRLRKVVLIGLPLAAAVCLTAWLVYHFYQNDPDVREHAARHAAQKVAQPQPQLQPSP